jgi:hypothetical protein
LYSSAQARPSSVTAQCSSAMPPPLEKTSPYSACSLVGAPVEVGVAGRLAHVVVRLDRGGDRFDVAGRKGALILADDVGLVEVEVRLEQRRAVRVAAGQRPGTEVQAQLDDARVLVAVGDERQGKADASAAAVEVKDDLFDHARIRDEDVDVLDVDIACRQPGGHVGDEAPERAFALDPPAYRGDAPRARPRTTRRARRSPRSPGRRRRAPI